MPGIAERDIVFDASGDIIPRCRIANVVKSRAPTHPKYVHAPKAHIARERRNRISQIPQGIYITLVCLTLQTNDTLDVGQESKSLKNGQKWGV